MSDSANQKIALSKLPSGGEILVGRESELAQLDDALQSESTHVISFVAWGGTGKSALADHWMAAVSADDWRGIDRYFDWSFYSQGTRGEQGTSADLFIAEALKFFGDPDPQAGSPHDRGERLAKLAAGYCTLLILDGLEPMQFGPGTQEGQIKDPALRSLLRSIAQKPFQGLCVLTTREPVKDLERFHGTTFIEKKLENLSPLAGAKLLHHRGVDHAGAGKLEEDDQELRDAVEEVDGHALTLQLMGHYLKRAHGGDIRRKDRFGFEPAMKNKKDEHAFRVIAVYERWLSGRLEVNDDPEQHEQQYDPEQGERMLAVLRMLGLFDRPARPDCLDALRQNPIIPGLNEPLVDLDEEEWTSVLSDLEKLELVKLEASDKPPAKIVDAHPLIREYFAKQLKSTLPQKERGAEQNEAPATRDSGGSLRSTPATPKTQDTSPWTEGHRRLFEHLCKTTENQPDSIPGLQPLYQAVSHGCKAGLHWDAFFAVYVIRISRGGANAGSLDSMRLGGFSAKTLGAVGSDLSAISCFFDSHWTTVSLNLPDAIRTSILGVASFLLRSVGRLGDAIQPAEAAISQLVEDASWGSANSQASNLSELELARGNVKVAVTWATRAVEFADHTGDLFNRKTRRARLGAACHAAGRNNDARGAFEEAERIQATRPGDFPRLYSLSGFQFCELLLSTPEKSAWLRVMGQGVSVFVLNMTVEQSTEVLNRANQWIDTNPDKPLLTTALEYYTRARAAFLHYVLSQNHLSVPTKVPPSVGEDTEVAMTTFRNASAVDFVPYGLLFRSCILFVNRQLEESKADLDEAWEIAERGPMPLHQADVLLTRARLFFREDLAKAWEDLNEAKRLVNKHGYHRRDEEIADAEEAFRIWEENHPAGDSPVATSDDDEPEEATVVDRDQVFISYAREDSKLMEELTVHLKPYKLPKWIDTDIKAGANWEDELRAAVKQTRVAVFLVSPDSLASDFINDEELGPLVAAKEAGEVTIVWVQLRPCAYDQTPLKDLQAVVSPPADPVAGLSRAKRDEAWVRVSREVKKALEL